MNVPEVVRRYATTLLDAAEETDVLGTVRKDVEGLLETFSNSQELNGFSAIHSLVPRFRVGRSSPYLMVKSNLRETSCRS